jgi:hypothetical protein
VGNPMRYCRRLVLVALAVAGAGMCLTAPAGEVIDNAKLEKMIREGISLDVVLKLLEPTQIPGEMQKASNCRFDASSEALITLQKAGKEGGWAPEDVKKMQTKIIELASKDQKYLKELVDRALNVFENADENEYELMMRELAREGKRVIPYLLAKENVESERQRGGIADSLGRMLDKSENVIATITRMLTDRSKPVRLQAAKAIVALADAKTSEELISRLNSRNVKLDGVAMALGYLGDAKAVEALTKLLKTTGDSDTRVCSAFSLGELRAKLPAAAEALLDAVLDEHDEKLREAAAIALGKIGEKRTPSYIIKAFYRYRPGRDLLIRELRPFKDISALDFLVEQVNNDDPKVKRASLETLRDMTGENETDSDGWRGVVEVLRTRPDWRNGGPAVNIPDAGGREGAAKNNADPNETIPTSTR